MIALVKILIVVTIVNLVVLENGCSAYDNDPFIGKWYQGNILSEDKRQEDIECIELDVTATEIDHHYNITYMIKKNGLIEESIYSVNIDNSTVYYCPPNTDSYTLFGTVLYHVKNDFIILKDINNIYIPLSHHKITSDMLQAKLSIIKNNNPNLKVDAIFNFGCP